MKVGILLLGFMLCAIARDVAAISGKQKEFNIKYIFI